MCDLSQSKWESRTKNYLNLILISYRYTYKVSQITLQWYLCKLVNNPNIFEQCKYIFQSSTNFKTLVYYSIKKQHNISMILTLIYWYQYSSTNNILNLFFNKTHKYGQQSTYNLSNQCEQNHQLYTNHIVKAAIYLNPFN